MNGLKKEFSKLIKVARNPMVRVLPGQIAFFLVLSIFPILILVGVIASFFSISLTSMIEAVQEAVPSGVADVLVPVLQGKGFDTHVGISMLTGFFLASNGAHSIILASNTLYGFPHAELLKRRIKSLFIIVLMIGLFVFTLLVLAFGDDILRAILMLIGSSSLTDIIYRLVIYLRWPIAMLVMYFNVKLIYTMAPDWKILSKYTTKGAIFTTIGWVIATAIYSYYTNHFSNYSLFYGGISNIVILMIWIYALSYILVVGIAINVSEYQNEDEENN